MARENRFARRILGSQCDDFLKKSAAVAFARLCESPSGVVYLFLATPRSWSREQRVDELRARCIVAKDEFLEAETVIGIAAEQYDSSGFSIDVRYFEPGQWTDEDRVAAEHLKQDFGFFRDPTQSRVTVDEYPTTGSGDTP